MPMKGRRGFHESLTALALSRVRATSITGHCSHFVARLQAQRHEGMTFVFSRTSLDQSF